jgi:hypothetical protein
MSDKPYKVIVPGINGGGSQVFEAETPEEMQQQFQQAQENATAKIRELAAQVETFQQQIQQTKPPDTTDPNAFDRQKFFSMLYEKPEEAITYAIEKKLGVNLPDFMQDYQTVRTGAQIGIQNAVNAQFAQKHPELLQVTSQEDDLHNGKVLADILTEHGWSYTVANLDAALALAKAENKLKLMNASFSPEAQLPPAPTTVSRPTGQVNSSEAEDEFLRTAPINKVKEYLEKKYPTSQRV